MMVEIVGNKEEVKLLVEVLNSGLVYDFTTYKRDGMKRNEFGVQGTYKNKDLDYIVKTKYIQ